MHFWIDKRSSQLHQYGGGRRGPRGAGGFYSQNFGTHRSSHHPPPSLDHHHRLRTRSSSTTTPTTSGNNASNNNSSISNTNSTNNNYSHSANGNTIINSSTAASTSAGLHQYPHQQPHQVHQQQHVHAGYSGALGSHAGNTTSSVTIRGGQHSNDQTYKNTNHPTSFFHHPPQQQPVLGGGILSISGSSGGAQNAATSMNPSMAIAMTGDDGASTAVLALPSSAAVTVNPSNSINVQLISCVNINPDNRGGIDLSWRNPYHVPGSSISRCRAYARDLPPGLGNAPTTSRGTRGRRPSGSSSSGLGRNSIGTGTTIGGASTHSQSAPNETPEGVAERVRSLRSEHTSIDRDTITPQRSLSLTSPDPTGGEQLSSRGTSGRASLENDPNWACTKRVGLTLCFLAFILLGTVGAKFMIQGPGVMDTSRTGKAEAAAYFLFTELIFVAFAMALFFTGVACLRKRTNDYLLRQFNQYILNTSATTGGVAGSTMGGIPGQDAYDFEYYDSTHPPSSMVAGAGSPGRGGHHHHHHHHHGGFHHYRHHPSNGSLLEEGDYEGGAGDLTSPHNFHGAGPIHYPAHYNGSSTGGGSSRRSKPPPYHIALFLPLPEGMGGGSSPTEENQNSSSHNEHDGNKSSKSGDGIGFIDSASVKDVQDAGGNVNYSNSSNSQARDSSERNVRDGDGSRDRSETPPPPYEQL